MPTPPSVRLRELGLELPEPAAPAGSYAPAVVDGDHVWVSGQIVSHEGKARPSGKVDRDVDLAGAKAVAGQATLQGLAAIARVVGGIDRIRRIVRVGVYVASSEGFTRQHEVGNGATELLIELFGEDGRPSRASMGVYALPLNAPVEIDLLARIG
ncbi:MAG: RidA family protein [Thermoplasmata archaeon]|nr:RidA family protein [Thermoplasmata archaeon]